MEKYLGVILLNFKIFKDKEAKFYFYFILFLCQLQGTNSASVQYSTQGYIGGKERQKAKEGPVKFLEAYEMIWG